MCGRYSLYDPEELYETFSVVNRHLHREIIPHYHIAPSSRQPVIVKHSPNSVELMTWGIVPPWMRREGRIRGQIINARCETLFEKPMFRGLLTLQRCLVPANGFFEWK
jgi:putative SOS response-associated peptidase YedK